MAAQATSSSSSATTTTTTILSLPPGFRFHPTDMELVSYYLKRKISGLPFRRDVIRMIELYKFEPWDLPSQSTLKSADREWYFFAALDRKYGMSGSRTKRATEQGYWKMTGKDRPIQQRNAEIVGMKKTLVFYTRRAYGTRTNWIMHEYRLVDKELTDLMLESHVLCKIFYKNSSGPNNHQNGAQLVDEWVPWDDKFFDVEDYIKESVQEQNFDMGIPYEISPFPSSSFVEGYNYIDGSINFVKDDQKLFIGSSDEIDDRQELPNEQILLDLPEQHQKNPAPLEESLSAELKDIAEHLVVDYLNDHSFDANHNPPVHDTHFLEHGNLSNLVEADLLWFEKVNDWLACFDATDHNSQFVDQDLDTILERSNFTLEKSNKFSASPLPLEIDGGEGEYSSKQIPVSAELVQDAKFNEDCDSAFTEQISCMLGLIDAPPAFSSEFPIKGAFFG